MAEFHEIANGLAFPEGPVALADGSVLVVEVARDTLTRIAQSGDVMRIAELGGGPNGAAIGPDGRCYVCNNGGIDFKRDHEGRIYGGLFRDTPGSIQVVDLNTGKFETLYTEADGLPLSAPNDLVFDDQGGFWFTDRGKVFRHSEVRGAICYAKADGSFIQRVFAPMLGPNGIGLSPNGKLLYVAETVPARLWAFEIGEPGELTTSEGAQLGRKGKLVAGLPGYQFLDSLAVDSAGWICVGTIMNGGITAISSDGSAIHHIHLPDTHTTNLCFGGPNMQTVFVTLATTGRLLALEWPRPGLPLLHQIRRSRQGIQ